MKTNIQRGGVAVVVVLGIVSSFATSYEIQAVPPETSRPQAHPAAVPLPSATEARQQADLLHEALHAALQVVHHEYYREDEGLAIPAATLKKVFHELESRKKIKLRWLAVDAKAMNSDHLPQDEFERSAVTALAAGNEAHELVDGRIFRHAGPITLTSECLKCHLPNRKSNQNRLAGLVIEIPIAP